MTDLTPEQEQQFRAAMKSPIDKAMENYQLAKRNPTPDFALKQEQTERALPDAPIDYDPRSIIGAGHGAEAARSALGQLYETWNVIEAAARDYDVPLKELGRVAQRAMERGLSAADATVGNLADQISSKQKQIDSVLKPKTSATEAAEIRAFLRTEVMDWRAGDKAPGKGTKGSAEVVRLMKKDPRFTYAIFSAPPELSGLNDDQYARVHQEALNHYVPEFLAEKQELEKAHGKLTTAIDRMIQTLGPKLATWNAKENKNLTALRKMS